MSRDKIIRIVRLRWEADGRCVTCAARTPLSEYGDLEQAVRVNTSNSAIELSCLALDGQTHRGVRIRFGA